MTLQKRIARATCLWEDCPGSNACQRSNLGCGEFSLNRALRVMAAIREPDEAMIGAGQAMIDEGGLSAVSIWQAMLSAGEEGK